ncbi:MAG: CAP domain-containing protein [Burkholderiaceae bacterium]
MPAAPPLRWNGLLGEVSLAHSRDMATRNALAHTGADGSRARQRVVRRGYAARSVGENVAAGQGSAEQVVADWIASPSHCENLKFPAFTEMGAAYVVDLRSAAVIHWTQVFARPLRPARSTPALSSLTQAR